MADVFSKSKRSEIMSKIRSKNTGLEKHTKIILRKNKVKFRTHPKLYGKPDFLLEKKTVLFCDSSFWHGRNWKLLQVRLKNGGNSNYWVTHIEKNRKRDKLVNKKLKEYGYTVIRFWDSDLFKRPDWCIVKIKENSIRL